jgi:pimeloyl-ACP methyl ester carboxylesterase
MSVKSISSSIHAIFSDNFSKDECKIETKKNAFVSLSAIDSCIEERYLIDTKDVSNDDSNLLKSKEDLKKIQEALNEANDKIKDPQRLTIVVGEILAKGLAYTRIVIEQGKEFYLQVPQVVNGQAEMMLYSCHAWDLGNSNFAYILEPKTIDQKVGVPFVVFRGTIPWEIGTLKSSLGVKSLFNLFFDDCLGIANEIINEKNEEFIKVLKELHLLHGEKPSLIGHSLGGALAQRFAVKEQNIDLISGALSFNSPGIPSEDCQKWDEHIQKNPNDSSKVLSFAVDYDFVNLTGHHYFVGKKYFFHQKDELSWMQIHGTTLLGRAGKIEEVERVQKTTLDKVIDVAIYPLRAAGVAIAIVFSLIFIEFLFELVNYLFTLDFAIRKKVIDTLREEFENLKGNQTPMLEQIRMISQNWWIKEISAVVA